MYLAIIGFAMVAVIVALLLKGKMSPIVVLITIPTIAALLSVSESATSVNSLWTG